MFFNNRYGFVVFTAGLSLGLSGLSTLHAAPAADPAVGALTLEPVRALVAPRPAPSRWEQAEAQRQAAQLTAAQAAAAADLLAARFDDTPPVFAFADADAAPAAAAPALARALPDDPAPLPDAAPAADRFAVPSVADLAVRFDPAFAADMLAAPGRTRLASEAAATSLGNSGTLPSEPAFAGTGGSGTPVASAGPGGTAERVTALAAASRFEAAGGSWTETRLLAAVPAAGLQPAAAFTPSGAAYAWGLNGSGQLGNNSTVTYSDLPVMVSSSADGTFTNTGVTAIAAGTAFSLAVQGGVVYAWGYNYNGQLGNGTTGTAANSRPVVVSSVTGGFTNSGVTAVAAGGAHSLAVQSGVVYAWGLNTYGQLGNNTTTSSSVPVAVSPSADGTFTNMGVTAVAGGASFSLAVQNGAAYAWGSNASGQLGNNTTTSSSVPVAVSPSADGTFTNMGVTAVAGGGPPSAWPCRTARPTPGAPTPPASWATTPRPAAPCPWRCWACPPASPPWRQASSTAWPCRTATCSPGASTTTASWATTTRGPTRGPTAPYPWRSATGARS